MAAWRMRRSPVSDVALAMGAKKKARPAPGFLPVAIAVAYAATVSATSL